MNQQFQVRVKAVLYMSHESLYGARPSGRKRYIHWLFIFQQPQMTNTSHSTN